MSDPQTLERDLKEYLEKEPNLRRDDRLSYLTTIFNKHAELNKLEHVINNVDLYRIIGDAKGNYSKQSLPLYISKRAVESPDLPHISVIESFIGYLNKMNLLKKLVKFDYTR